MRNITDRKTLITVLLAFCFCMILTACSGENTKKETPVTHTQETSYAETGTDTPAPARTAETDASAARQNESDIYEPDTEAAYHEDVKFNIETYTDNHVEVQYIQAAGLHDTVQEKLNQNIMDFYLWQWTDSLNSEADTTEYYGTAAYAFTGKRLLSVQRYLSATTEDAAYPVNEISTQTFDIMTGEPVGALNAAPFTDEIIRKFKLTQPGADVPDELAAKAEQSFKAYVLGADEIYNYFLTDTGVAIYIMNDVHAEGDYFIFEADLPDIAGMLAEPIKSALSVD